MAVTTVANIYNSWLKKAFTGNAWESLTKKWVRSVNLWRNQYAGYQPLNQLGTEYYQKNRVKTNLH
jgi:hypothetical protein